MKANYFNGLSFGFLLATAVLLNAQPASEQPVCSGTVVDSNGKPVEGATVVLYDNSVSPREKKNEIRTAQDGKFEFKLPNAGFLVIAEKAGLAPDWIQYWRRGDESKDEKLILSAPSVLAGTIVDDNDKPVAGAEVWIEAALMQREVDGRSSYNYLTGSAGRRYFSVKSDADGKFQISNCPSNIVCDLGAFVRGKILRVPEREYLSPDTMLCRAGDKDIKLVVEPAGSLEGKVVEKNSGKPIQGAYVSLETSQRRGVFGSSLQPVESDAQGVFRFPSLATGEYRIHAAFGTNRIPDWVAEIGKVSVDRAEAVKDVKIEAIRGGFLEVSVTGKDTKKPLGGITVRIYSDTYSAGGVTDTNGGVGLLRAVPGEYKVSAYQDNQTPEPVSAEVAEGQTNRVEIEMSPPPMLMGTVLDPEGKPCPGLQIQIMPEWRANIGNVKTDEQGRFKTKWNPQRYSGMNEGMSILVRDTKRNLAISQEIEESTQKLELRLQPGLTITGEVRNESNEPLTNAPVRFFMWSGNTGSTIDKKPAQTDAQGKFRIPALPPERKYSLNASAKGYGSQGHEIPAGNESNVDAGILTVKLANQKIAGQVVDEEDKPAAKASVHIYGNGQPNTSIVADSDGRFSFDVCEGTVDMSASLKNTHGNARFQSGDTNAVLKLGRQASYSSFAEAPRRASLKGKPLPDLSEMKMGADCAPEGKPVLLCLFDCEQRPSRRFVKILAEQCESLKGKGLVVLALQAAPAADETWKEWKDANAAPFPVGIVPAADAKTKWVTEAERLPWLILTDGKHAVTAEGFPLEDLDSKLKASEK